MFVKLMRVTPYIALCVCVTGVIIGSGDMVQYGGSYVIGYFSREAFGDGPISLIIACLLAVLVGVFLS